MTITRRDNYFIASPAVVPGKADALINNFASGIDKNLLNILKALVNDLEDYKKSLHGIIRRPNFDDMLFIYNYATQKNTDVQEALRMDKYGNFAIGTEYPRWPRCKVDVNGPLYAIPQYGFWHKSVTDAAGVGLYTWDTEDYNPNTDIYTRVNTNTQIKIDEPGVYDVRANIYVQDTVVATGTGVVVQMRQNGGVISRGEMAIDVADLAWLHMTKIINVSRGDLIDINLASAATSQKFGGSNALTYLEICKVN